MNINIHCIGKIKNSDSENVILNDYKKRMSWSLSIKEYVLKKTYADSVKKSLEESNLLLSSCGSAPYIVALDSSGKMFSSQDFSKLLVSIQNSGINKVDFCIGGSYGHHDSLLQKSHLKLSLGPMTLAHKLARIVLVEQIYRAETIIGGHPYHK